MVVFVVVAKKLACCITGKVFLHPPHPLGDQQLVAAEPGGKIKCLNFYFALPTRHACGFEVFPIHQVCL